MPRTETPRKRLINSSSLGLPDLSTTSKPSSRKCFAASGGVENAQMMDDIRNKYAAPQKPEGFVEKITSPFYKSDLFEDGK
jgi:hypothetical protein